MLLPWVTLQRKEASVKSDFDRQWDAARRKTATAVGQALSPPGMELSRVRLLRKEWKIGRLVLRVWKRIA